MRLAQQGVLMSLGCLLLRVGSYRRSFILYMDVVARQAIMVVCLAYLWLLCLSFSRGSFKILIINGITLNVSSKDFSNSRITLFKS